jgi:phosphoserine phosphatase RsbU/P
MMEALVMDNAKLQNLRPPRVLLADDQPDILEALRFLLKRDGFEVVTANSPRAILQALGVREFDLLVMDLNYASDTTSGQEGLDLLARIRVLDDTLPVVAMTAWGSVELAVEAMHRGVGDFVLKPWDNDRLLTILRMQIGQGQSRRQARRLKSETEEAFRIEVREAGEVQQRLMPKDFPAFPGYDISAASRPARIIGGDYFDVFKSSERELGLCIADVAGKGIPAALLMSNLQATVQAAASEAAQPRRFIERVNSVLHRNVASEKFVTLFYGLLDAPARRLTYINAGHNAPFLLGRDGSILRLKKGGPVLGVFAEGEYEQGEAALHAGDRLVLFTDGVSEAANAPGEEFGEERLMDLLRQSRELEARDLRNRIFEAVDDFSSRQLQDDATVVVVAVK